MLLKTLVGVFALLILIMLLVMIAILLIKFAQLEKTISHTLRLHYSQSFTPYQDHLK